jgi:hypothetical protein
MSNVQNVVGALFAKVRHVEDKLADVDKSLVNVDMRLKTLDYKLNSVIWLLDEQKKCIDEQKKRNDCWFVVVLGTTMGIFWCLMYLTTMYMKTHGLCVAHVHVVHEPVQDRSNVSTIADELFAWLFLRPWYE